MRLRLGGWILAGCVVLMSQSAFGVSLSAALKNYYAEYEIVLDCEEKDEISEADGDLAEAAIDKIEMHYLKREPTINKERLMDRAAADKDEGFRIMARSGGGLRPYCRQSLRELLIKAKEIDPDARGQ